MVMAEDIWIRTIGDYSIYIKLERGLAANSVEAYLRDVQSFARYVVESFGVSPSHVEQRHIESFLDELYELGVERSSAARMLSSIKSLFEYLIIDGVLTSSPADLIQTPRKMRHLPDLLTLEEVDQILNSIDTSTTKGVRDRALIELLYSCGLRASEAVTLQLGDLFFEDGYIRVVGKGSKQRLIPISPVAQQRVQEYLALRNEDGKASDREHTLFLNNRGRGLSRVMLFTLIKRYVTQAGLKHNVSPHTFRHSFATHLLHGGASIREVQEMLGHESISTTEIYTHLNESSLREAVERL